MTTIHTQTIDQEANHITSASNASTAQSRVCLLAVIGALITACAGNVGDGEVKGDEVAAEPQAYALSVKSGYLNTVADEYYEAKIRGYVVLHPDEDGQSGVMETKLCGLDIPKIHGVRPKVKQSGLENATTSTPRYSWQEDAAGNLRLVTDGPMTAMIGAVLDDIENDEIPQDKDDPRLVDADDDNKPGVSLKVGIFGKIHVAVRVGFNINALLRDRGDLFQKLGVTLDPQPTQEKASYQVAVLSDSLIIPGVNAKKMYDESLEIFRNSRTNGPDQTKVDLGLSPLETIPDNCDDI